MHRVVRMFKNAKTKEDGLWLLSLLEGSGAPGEQGAETPWLTQFVDQDGLSAMGAWLCDDNCLGTTVRTNILHTRQYTVRTHSACMQRYTHACIREFVERHRHSNI